MVTLLPTVLPVLLSVAPFPALESDCAARRYDACIEAARGYLGGPKEKPVDPERAVSLLDWACTAGHTPACIALAEAFERLAAAIPPGTVPCRISIADMDSVLPEFKYDCSFSPTGSNDEPPPIGEVRDRVRKALSRACFLGDEDGCRRSWAGDHFGKGMPRIFLSESRIVSGFHRLDLQMPVYPDSIGALLDRTGRILWIANSGVLRAFDAVTGEPLGTPRPIFDGPGWPEQSLSVSILGMANTPKGDLRILLKGPEGLRIWEPVSGTQRKIEVGNRPVCGGLLSTSGERMVLAFGGTPPPGYGACHPEAKGATLEIRNVADGALVRELPLPGVAQALASNRDGTVVAASVSSTREIVIEGPAGTRTLRWPNGVSSLSSLSLDARGGALLAVAEREAWLWPSQGAEPRRFEHQGGAGLTSDGKQVILAGWGTLTFVNAATGRPLEAPLAINPPDVEWAYSCKWFHLSAEDDHRIVLLPCATQPILLQLRGAPELSAVAPEVLRAIESIRPIPLPPPARVATHPRRDGTVTGTVLREGKPVPGAEVELHFWEYNGWREPPMSTVADATGRFRFTQVPRVNGSVRAAAAGARTGDYHPHPVLLEDNVQVDVTVELVPAVTIRGRVVDAAGKPVPQAKIEVKKDTDLVGQTVSAADGRWTIDSLSPATYTVYATKPGVGFGATSAAAELPQPLDVTVQLRPPTDPSVLWIRVMTEGGRPLPDAVLNGHPDRNVDAQGRLAVPFDRQVPEHVELDLYGKDWRQRVELEGVKGGVETIVRIPVGVLQVTGVGSDELVLYGPDGRSELGNAREFRGLQSGQYRLVLRRKAPAPGTPRQVFLDVVLGPDEHRVVAADQFRPGNTLLRGRVVDVASGLPRTGVQIETRCAALGPQEDPWVHSAQYLDCTAISGPDGRFEITGVQPGRHAVKVSSPNFAKRILTLEASPSGGDHLVEVWAPRTIWIAPADLPRRDVPPSTRLRLAVLWMLLVDSKFRPNPNDDRRLTEDDIPPHLKIDLRWPGFDVEETERGLRVRKVDRPDVLSPSLEPGDLIVGVGGGGHARPSARALRLALESPREVMLQVERAGKVFEVKVMPRPDIGSISSFWWPGD